MLRGLAPDALLDTVETERQPQTEWVIRFAIELGKVLCELDPEAAAERDATLRGADAPPPPLEFPPLGDGVVHRAPDGSPDPLAGTLGVQGLVAVDGREGLFDDVVGRGWTLIAADGDPLEQLDDGSATCSRARRDGRLARTHACPEAVTDVDGRLTEWLRRHGAHAVLVRPDFYVFGSVASRDEPAGAGQRPAGATGA